MPATDSSSSSSSSRRGMKRETERLISPKPHNVAPVWLMSTASIDHRCARIDVDDSHASIPVAGFVDDALAYADDVVVADVDASIIDTTLRDIEKLLDDEAALSTLPGERDAFERTLRACRFRLRRARESRASSSGRRDRDRDADDAASAAVTLRSCAETLNFWRSLDEESENSPAVGALCGLLRLALTGHDGAGVDGTRILNARTLAQRYRPSDVDEDEPLTTRAMFKCADELVAWQSAANFGSGFVAGLGGLVTLPLTIPAQLAATTFTSLRLAFAIAILAGKSPLHPTVAARAITSALGGVVEESDGEMANACGVEAADRSAAVAGVGSGVQEATQYAALRGSGTALQGAAWKLTRIAATRLAQRGAQRGASMAVTRAVPIIGGVIGGTVDSVMTTNAGNRAMDAFLPPRPKNAAPTLEASIRRSKDEAVANVKVAAEALNGAIGKMSLKIKTSFTTAGKRNSGDDDATPTSAGYQSKGFAEDDAWDKFEHERELEAMRAVLEDDACLDDLYRDVFSSGGGGPTPTCGNQRRRKEKERKPPDEIARRAAKDEKKQNAWREHDAAWKVFIEDHNANPSREIRYRDVPWPPSTSRILLGSAGIKKASASRADVKLAFRRLMLRFHPDRFSKFSLSDKDRVKILDKLTTISAAIKDQWIAYERSVGGVSAPLAL